MSTESIKAKQFVELINSTLDIFLIVFWKEGCAYSNQFIAVYELFAYKNPSIKFIKMNIEEEAELATSLKISSTPHLMIFKEGVRVYSETQMYPKELSTQESILKDWGYLEYLLQQTGKIDLSEALAQYRKSKTQH